MSIFRTIAMLATAALGVAFFYAVGFAIAEHHIEPVFIGIGCLVAAGILLFLQLRFGRDSRESDRSRP
jgi:hypothetical protein